MQEVGRFTALRGASICVATQRTHRFHAVRGWLAGTKPLLGAAVAYLCLRSASWFGVWSQLGNFNWPSADSCLHFPGVRQLPRAVMQL